MELEAGKRVSGLCATKFNLKPAVSTIGTGSWMRMSDQHTGPVTKRGQASRLRLETDNNGDGECAGELREMKILYCFRWMTARRDGDLAGLGPPPIRPGLQTTASQSIELVG